MQTLAGLPPAPWPLTVQKRLLGRPGIDGQFPARPRLGLTLDAEPKEVEAIIDVADPGLLLRQGQAHRSEDHHQPSRAEASAWSRVPWDGENDEESRRGDRTPRRSQNRRNLSAYTAPIVQPAGLRPKRQ